MGMAVICGSIINGMENHHQQMETSQEDKKADEEEQSVEMADVEDEKGMDVEMVPAGPTSKGEQNNFDVGSQKINGKSSPVSGTGQTRGTTTASTLNLLVAASNSAEHDITHADTSPSHDKEDNTQVVLQTSTKLFSADDVQKSVEAAVNSVAIAKSNEESEHQTKMCSGPSFGAAKPVKNRKHKKRTPPPVQPGQSTGRWTRQEHEAFLEGLKVYGREWKKVANHIPTRSSAQVRSHAQKYFAKLARDDAMLSQQESQVQPANEVAAEATALSANYPPSVQRNVERILENPSVVQDEVEAKMRALRERYRQLQRCLEERSTNSQQSSLPDQRMVEADEVAESVVSSDGQRKRRRGEERKDDASVASSTLSSLGNEELIALSVLGGALPNGDLRSRRPAASSGNNEQNRETSTASSSLGSGGLPDADGDCETASTSTSGSESYSKENKRLD